MDWSKTYRKIQDYQPDLVIYQWWATFWAPATSWLIHKITKAGINTKILIHNAFPHESTWIDKKLTAWALREAVSFVTMTDAEAKRLRTVVNPQAEIITAPHPVYRQFPSSDLSKVEVRKNSDCPLKHRLLCFSGLFDHIKG
jgi:hypothetical protein